MSGCSKHSLLAWALSIVLAGCSPPTPTASTGPPPPPPEPVVKAPPPAPPAPQPDPYEVAMQEVGTIVKRYGTLYAGVRDEKTADKAVEEIGKMSARLRELAGEIGKMPHRPGQEKETIALAADLSRLTATMPLNPDVQSNIDVQLKLATVQHAFTTEVAGVLAAAGFRQTAAPQTQPAPNEVKP